jgi:putative ABC transport system ATP-binding protein
MPAFIEAVELRKTYRVGKIDVPALRGISFNVQKGEFVSVVGPSGSGKSTLFYLLGGLTRADSGHVIIDGDDFAQLSDAERTRLRKRKIGFVFQKFNLLPTLNAQANIDIAVEIAGTNGVRDATYFNKIVGLLGLEKRLPHRPSELSGARRQRVALARALVNKPAIVLATTHGQSGLENPRSCWPCCGTPTGNWARPCSDTHNPEAATYGDRHSYARRRDRGSGKDPAVDRPLVPWVRSMSPRSRA